MTASDMIEIIMKTTKTLLSILTITAALATQIHAQNWLTNGLVAYYPLNGNANDGSGNGNNGAILNMVNDTDRFATANSSFYFNGTNSELSVERSLLDLGKDYTVSLWFKFQDVSRERQLLFGTRRDFGIAIDYNDPPTTPARVINWAVGKGTYGWNVAYIHGDKTNYLSDHWYQLIFKKSQHDYRMYIDGTLESALTVADDFTLSPSVWDFGFVPAYGFKLNGNLDDIRIYSRALSDSEVQQLYAIESGPRLDLIKAVKPTFSNLTLTTNYQMQVSTDMSTWTNEGFVFTATNTSMVYPQYFDVANWNSLFFRLQVAP